VVTSADHKVVARAKRSTNPEGSPEETVADMYATAEEAITAAGLNWNGIEYIGAAVPSPVDPITGECLQATNLGWKNVSLKELLKKEFGKEVVLGNDANLGLLGEHYCGAAKGFRSSVGYFIGTGLGGAIIIDGKLHLGNKGVAGELGHCTVKVGGRRCGCGNRGCLEAYCSKVAFVKALKKEVFKRGECTMLPEDKFNEKSRNIKSKYLARAYENADPVVRKVIDKGLRMLGVAAASICSTLSPECIVIGGGFAEALGDSLLPPFEAAFRPHLFGLKPEDVVIRLSALGDDAVAVGATLLARGI
jgi:glucokinase